eukprot:CAMPEP_0172469306 /NCGR_PEP_ID=MMETSP1065-20121228/63442_1 /TAXON_ID=265537 /ORGANISM="Amphiprora paludosa, Strain CCMP125" /LENGTH=86 /DNA_ID=CAMNT_0013226945 /DNA_START=267 /DNA_END=524 /DNA_ORIENTATION=-
MKLFLPMSLGLATIAPSVVGANEIPCLLRYGSSGDLFQGQGIEMGECNDARIFFKLLSLFESVQEQCEWGGFDELRLITGVVDPAT